MNFNYISKIPQGVKASVAFLFASLVSKAIAYITTPIFTRLLTPEEYGQVSVFLTWLQIIGIPAMFCLSYGVFNNGMIDYPDRRSEYSYSMLILSNLITLLLFGFIILFYPYVEFLIGLEKHYIVLMFLIFILQPAFNFWLSRQRYELQYKKPLAWSVIMAIIAPVCAIIAIKFTDNDPAFARVFGGEIPLLIIYIGFYYFIAKSSLYRLDTHFWKAAILFNLPLIPHYLSTFLLGSLDRLMISKIIGDAETAFYTVAYSVASVATIVWTAINSSLIPYTYEKCRENNFTALSKVTNPLLALFFVACVFIILMAPEVVEMLATKEYYDAIYVIPPVVGGVFFQVQYFIYANVVYYFKRPKYIMYASVFATITNYVLNAYFIPRFGFIAAGYTTLASYLIQVVFDYLAMKKVVGKDVYDMRFIIIISIIVMFISVTSYCLYDMAIVRYLIIITLGIFCVVFRHFIKNVILSIRK